MGKKLIPLVFAILIFGGAWSSCRYNPMVTHPCDTCNINQDSLIRIKDSLAHAFTWQQLSIPGEASLTGVWVFGENDIYILGSSLWHYDGATFTLVNILDRTHHTMLNGALADDGLFAFSKSDFWITSFGGEALHTSDGKNCDDYRFGGVNACWGTSSSDMFFVGNGGSIFHFDGASFVNMNSITTKDLRSVWGTSSSDVWATGWNSSTGQSILLHYDGISWAEDVFSTSGKANQYAIGSVWACDSMGHTITVISGTRVFHKTDNGNWRADTSEVGNSLGGGNYVGIGTSGVSSTDLFAVGGWGFVSHWNGKN